jgi:hypothetical protein
MHTCIILVSFPLQFISFQLRFTESMILRLRSPGEGNFDVLVDDLARLAAPVYPTLLVQCVDTVFAVHVGRSLFLVPRFEIL